MVPSAALAWLSRKALQRDREMIAVRFRAMCQDQLMQGRRRWESAWEATEMRWTQAASYESLAQEPLFAAIMWLDPPFPTDDVGSESKPTRPLHGDWPQARWLEYREGRFEEALICYAGIEHVAADTEEAWNAWKGKLRCLVKDHRIGEAFREWEQRRSTNHHRALWETALYLLEDGHLPEESATALASQLRDWLGEPTRSNVLLSLSQRLFFMETLSALGIDCPTLASERRLASLTAEERAPPESPLLFVPAGDALWKARAFDGRSQVFLDEADLAQIIRGGGEGNAFLTVHPPSETESASELRQELSGPLRGWTLAVDGSQTNELLSATAGLRKPLTVWVSGLSVAGMALVATVLCRAILREAKLNRLKNDFLAAVTHELKTPVTAIGVLVDHLDHKRSEDRSSQEITEYLGLIGKENDRLGRLIDHFLSFSRMERNKRHFDNAPVALSEILDEAVKVVKARYPEEASRIVHAFPREALLLEGDRAALTTVVVNLLDNAIKYSEETIQLAYGSEGSVATIAVSDSGIGMNAEEISQAFEKFYRADQSLTNARKGVGLGLSIVDFIVRAHGGSVSIESHPGQGSTFTVTLPLLQDASGC